MSEKAENRMVLSLHVIRLRSFSISAKIVGNKSSKQFYANYNTILNYCTNPIYEGFGIREPEQEHEMKPLVWVGSSHEDLKAFPSEVQHEMGYALYVSQKGDKHPKAKPLKGFSGVMEIRSDYRTNTYRAVYTTKIGDVIYVLHAFQKKTKRGIQTPKKEVDLIKRRLKSLRTQ